MTVNVCERENPRVAAEIAAKQRVVNRITEGEFGADGDEAIVMATESVTALCDVMEKLLRSPNPKAKLIALEVVGEELQIMANAAFGSVDLLSSVGVVFGK